MTYKVLGHHRPGSEYRSEPLGFYIEPSWAVDLLLDVEAFRGTVHDPACGTGTIPKACAARGIACGGFDIADRGFGQGGIDFLIFDVREPEFDNIICNPPFTQAEAFIRQSNAIARRLVALILPIKFLCAEGRWWLFSDELPPARVWFLSSRPSMPPGGMGIEAKGGFADFCWVVWDRRHTPMPMVRDGKLTRGAIPTQAGWLIRRTSRKFLDGAKRRGVG